MINVLIDGNSLLKEKIDILDFKFYIENVINIIKKKVINNIDKCEIILCISESNLNRFNLVPLYESLKYIFQISEIEVKASNIENYLSLNKKENIFLLTQNAQIINTISNIKQFITIFKTNEINKNNVIFIDDLKDNIELNEFIKYLKEEKFERKYIENLKNNRIFVDIDDVFNVVKEDVSINSISITEKININLFVTTKDKSELKEYFEDNDFSTSELKKIVDIVEPLGFSSIVTLEKIYQLSKNEQFKKQLKEKIDNLYKIYIPELKKEIKIDESNKYIDIVYEILKLSEKYIETTKYFSEIDYRTKEKQQLSKDISETEIKIKNLELLASNKNINKERLSLLINEFAKNKSDYDNLTAEINKYTKDNENIINEIKNLNNDLNSFKTNSNHLIDEQKRLTVEVEAVEKEVNNLKVKNEELTNYLNINKEENEKLLSEYNILKPEYDICKQSVEEYKPKIEEMKRYISENKEKAVENDKEYKELFPKYQLINKNIENYKKFIKDYEEKVKLNEKIKKDEEHKNTELTETIICIKNTEENILNLTEQITEKKKIIEEISKKEKEIKLQNDSIKIEDDKIEQLEKEAKKIRDKNNSNKLRFDKNNEDLGKLNLEKEELSKEFDKKQEEKSKITEAIENYKKLIKSLSDIISSEELKSYKDNALKYLEKLYNLISK